jgi:hypothetical protein
MVGSHGGRPQLPLRRIFDTGDSGGYQVTMRKMERIGSLKAEICLNRVGTLWPARSALLSDPIDLLHFSPPARTPWDAPISVLERAENPAQRLKRGTRIELQRAVVRNCVERRRADDEPALV